MSTAADGGGPRRCVPGEVVAQVPREEPVTTTVRLGSGTTQEKADGKTILIRTTKAGVLRQTGKAASKRYWVETRHQRYVPTMEDLVVGIVLDCHGENYSVDIGGPQHALLPILDFTGATRRNRPMLGYGDVVYASVSLADRDIDPMVTCVEKNSNRSKGLGPLKGGYVVKVATGFSRDLLSGSNGVDEEEEEGLGTSPSNVLALLGESLQYECCLGVNGCLWVKGETHAETLLIKNAILNSQNISLSDSGREARKRVKWMIEELLKKHNASTVED
ncbi:exosome complex exonuclease [Chloropicon primus]|nr:exosome complex exonuclease [Chloropicon primus]UPR04373.1 exosome complex exonuclease [Chloropicon primus]|eukprot:QDZ25168.1 exosome complex exonuclease [Chloropicon primus]